ncbi:MAG: protein kinase [Gemmatimonadales bacterium]
MTAPLDRLAAALSDRYRLERELGAGGMATVYLAEDLKHKRRVAVKVLKPELAAVLGAERFVQEITTTAALQHPHILPLFDSGEADGFLYYVMPFIDGETLRAKLDRETQLGIEEAVRITVAVADALDYAHRQGVIHRDIKPENILLHEGRPMVADFGIALAVSAAAGGRMTETGLSLGTPHYMSPEQATAEKEISARSDVYSLASVLYEMLTGSPPHVGASAQQIIMKIVTEEAAPVTKLRKAVPGHVAAAVAQALEKLPADRCESAKAFAQALQDPSFRNTSEASVSAQSQHWTRARVAGVAAAVLTALVAGVLVGRSGSTPAQPSDYLVSEILPPEGEDLSERQSFGALSPDGRALAFVLVSAQGERRLWIRRLEGIVAELLPGTTGAESPFWSPDGQSIGFFAGGWLMRIDLGASAPRRICEVSSATSGSWGADDLIVFATHRGIERVGPSGCEVALPLDSAARTYRSPSLVGDGRSILFTRRSEDDMDNGAFGASILRGDLETGETTVVVPAALRPTFVPPNRIVYGRRVPDGFALFGQRASRDGSGVEGEPVALSGAVRDTDLELSYSASASGALIYLPTLGNREKLLVDRSGEVVDTVRQRRTWTFSAARAHRWVVMAGAWALWLYDLDRGVSTPLIQGEGQTFVADPVWAPGDTALAFGACSWASMEDVARPTRVPVDDCVRVTDWSPDGRHLVLEVGAASYVAYGAARSLVAFDLKEGAAVPLFDVTGVTSEATVSPDGALIAYTSWDTGTPEIYLRPFLAQGRAQRLTTGGARSPRWGADARELYYQTADGRVMVVRTNVGADLASAEPRQLFRAEGYSRTMFFDRGTSFDVTPDGQRFILRLRETVGRAVLVQNWAARLEGAGAAADRR